MLCLLTIKTVYLFYYSEQYNINFYFTDIFLLNYVLGI